VHLRRLHLVVEADESSVAQSRRIERRVDVVEHRAVDASRVLIQAPYSSDFYGVGVIQRLVVDVLAEYLLPELEVVLCVEDVEVPERVDGVRHRMLVARVEQRNDVVLLERQDSLVEKLFAGRLTLLGELLAHLAAHQREVLGVDARYAREVKRVEFELDGGCECTHLKPPFDRKPYGPLLARSYDQSVNNIYPELPRSSTHFAKK